MRPGETLTIQVDVKANQRVDDLDVSFAVHDWTNHLAADGSTTRAGAPLDPFDAKRRVRFALRSLPLTAGRYWVTIGLTSRETGNLYHVQTQRYWFEVQEPEGPRGRLDVPLAVDVEDL